MYLTVREIIDLAEFLGLEVGSVPNNDDDLDAQVQIGTNPAGIQVCNDEGIPERYRAVAKFDGCEYDEVQPLGEPMGKYDL